MMPSGFLPVGTSPMDWRVFEIENGNRIGLTIAHKSASMPRSDGDSMHSRSVSNFAYDSQGINIEDIHLRFRGTRTAGGRLRRR